MLRYVQRMPNLHIIIKTRMRRKCLQNLNYKRNSRTFPKRNWINWGRKTLQIKEKVHKRLLNKGWRNAQRGIIIIGDMIIQTVIFAHYRNGLSLLLLNFHGSVLFVHWNYPSKCFFFTTNSNPKLICTPFPLIWWRSI